MTLPESYLKAVEHRVFPGGRAPGRMGEVGSRVKFLWERFNARRGELSRGYMGEAEGLDAYIAAFLLPNAERVRAIAVAHLRAPLTRLIERAAARGRDVRILDFGAGPLSATAGLLAACDPILPASRYRVTAVDLSAPAIEEGARLLHAGFGRVAVEALATLDGAQGGAFDVVLAANVLNELPAGARASVLSSLAERVAPGGVLLVLEPGQDVHSRALSGARDAFLSTPEAAAFDLVAPCPHRTACPLSAESGRPDWCWFRHEWALPNTLRAVDEITGLEHRELAFSFVTFVRSLVEDGRMTAGPVPRTNPAQGRLRPKTPHPAPLAPRFAPEARAPAVTGNPTPRARVVSDFIRVPSAEDARARLLAHVTRNAVVPVAFADARRRLSSPDAGKVLLCTSSGSLEGCYLSTRDRPRAGPAADAWARGRMIILTTDQIRAREKARPAADAARTPARPVPTPTEARVTRSEGGARNRKGTRPR